MASAAPGGSLESLLERRFRDVNNTSDSIQGLSMWCIDNKKYHSFIVRHWIRCLKKADSSHRLNLFYVANDVIQNCKRKNAIVYRTAFAEVLRDAFKLVTNEGDPKVISSVERILSIWEDRSVYAGTLIAELRSCLVKEESPPETPVEQKTPVESKADLQSKIVAEFVPQALIDQLCKYKRSMEEVDMREKQLLAMRVDICSSEALKKLKDKAGGKKFSKDFEEGSAQLHEFVKFLEKESKNGPPLAEALGNADIFYEMQYKEVKIVANAYQTFANRVSHLKRKLDILKATLPDLDDSPIPSPSADAPSPTGSESPFHGMDMASPHQDGSAIDDDAEPPAPSPLSSPGGSLSPMEAVGENDNREVEDMDLSEEEVDTGGIIVEEKVEQPANPEVSTVPEKKETPVSTETPVKEVTSSIATSTAAAVESVDLAKIGSILNSLSSVIKNTGPLVESPPAAGPAGPSLKKTPVPSVAPQDPSSLVNLLSKVDVSPTDLLGALSKIQGQGSFEGIGSLLRSPLANVSSNTSSTGKIPPSPSSTSATSASAVSTQSQSLSSITPVPSSSSSTVRQSLNSQAPTQISKPASALVQALHRDMELTTETEPSLSSKSLESKIHNFLQGNSAFSAFDLDFSTNPALRGNNLSPATAADTQGGTPVRDEGGGTPTQDEIMDKPVVAPSSIAETAPVAYHNSGQQIINNPQQPDVSQNGQVYQPYMYGQHEMSEQQTTAPVAHYQQQMSAQRGGLLSGERAPGYASGAPSGEGFQGMSERGWYGDLYPEGSSQQPRGFNMVGGENQTSGYYPFNSQPPSDLSYQQGSTSPDFFGNVRPKFPPPVHGFDAHSSAPSSTMVPSEHLVPSVNTGEAAGARGEGVMSGMVVHDHQHKSMFLSSDSQYEYDRPRRTHPDELSYQDDPHHQEAPYFQEKPYQPPSEPYQRPSTPPQHYPRGQGRLTPPLSPPEDPYYAQEYQRRSPPPQHYIPRRPPPPMPHPEIRHPGLRPPHRPLHPQRHPHPVLQPHPRGPPRPPFPRFHGPDPRFRGKRPPGPGPGPGSGLGPRGGWGAGPMFPPKRPFLPPRY